MSQSVVHGFDTVLQVVIALAVLAMLVWPSGAANEVDPEGARSDSVGFH